MNDGTKQPLKEIYDDILYPLSSTRLSWMNSTDGLYSRDLQLSILHWVIMIFSTSPCSLRMRCCMNHN